MPSTKSKPVKPKKSPSRRPSAGGRSESGLSTTSFKTAAGMSDNRSTVASSEIGDEEDNSEEDANTDGDIEYEKPNNDGDEAAQAIGSIDDDADETETLSRHRTVENGAEDGSSSRSASPTPLFKNEDRSRETLNKSPPTSHDDTAILTPTDEQFDQLSSPPTSPAKKKLTDRSLLSPSPQTTPKRDDRKAVRSSYASHLTLPYQRADGSDYLDYSSKRASKFSTIGGYTSRRVSSRAGSYLEPDTDMRDSKLRSQSERGGGTARSSRLLAPSPSEHGGSRNSFQSQRGPASRYTSSVNEAVLRSPSRRDTALLSPNRRARDGADNLSMTSRGTARRPASVMSRMLDSESQVYPGTRIRKYIEPQLTDAMRRVMKQFSGHYMSDHRCNGYPIAVFVGATAIDIGSIINPIISGGVSLYFAPGHPKNMASILPPEDRVPSHLPNPKAPTATSLSRRAELRSAITALQTIYDLYRGRACAHICIDSAYVAKAWGTWIPNWELHGWPGEDEDEYDADRWEDEYHERRRGQRRAHDRRGDRYMDLPDRSRHGGHDSDHRRGGGSRRDYEDSQDDWLSSDPYADRRRGPSGGRRSVSERGGSSRRGGSRRGDYSDDYSSDEDRYGRRRRPSFDDRRAKPLRRAPGRRLVDEDLLRELADIRYEFAQVERDRRGSAHMYLIDRAHNPADRMARAVAKNEDGLLGAPGAAGSELGLDIDEAELSDRDEDRLSDDELEQEWAETRSRASRASKSTRGAKSGAKRSSNRDSITSNATARLRTSTSLPSGHLRGPPRRHLDTFAEEDEYDLSGEAAETRSIRSVRSARSVRSRKSTRAERERDDYLARQERLELEREDRHRSVKRASKRPPPLAASASPRLAPPASISDRGSARRSVDVPRSQRPSKDLLRGETESVRRASMDSRRTNTRSQPNMRSRFSAQPAAALSPESQIGSVRGALASAARNRGRKHADEDDDEVFTDAYGYEDDNGRDRNYHMAGIGSGRNFRADPGFAGPRQRSHSHNPYPDMDDLVPPSRPWDTQSNRSPRRSSDRRRPSMQAPDSPASTKRSLFARKPKHPIALGALSNRSSPAIAQTQMPAPEDPDYQWKGSRPGEKKGFFGKLFGRGKK
ncbi:hypothetical protein BCV70DRAFT_15848 [Testicularia cyperi]|uniref:RNase H type-1 domain-containing protein n=1 Tax=Testicularia cyperi TaxID=1882483 RepID=A0A317XZZ4_9BASI|nr:hypothetical protein BCV70DRAFT_15848 [Testicularia cyperi]